MVEQRRGKNVALAGLAMQTVFVALMAIIWLWTGSVAAMSSLWLLGGGVVLWLMTAVLMYVRQLAGQEDLEMEQLGKGGQAQTIFERDQDTRPAAARVAWFGRWMTPGFTLAWAALQTIAGIYMLRYLLGRTDVAPLESPFQGGLLLCFAAFAGLLMGAYAIGMSRLPQWRLLRAAGSYLLVNTLFVGATAVAVFMAWINYPSVDRIVGYVVPAVQLVLAAELALNFLLDLYRPRLPDQEHRPSFDSRLFNLIAEPGKVGHSIAEAMNYQFGFEVSKTWFYQLVGRSMAPLLVAGAAIMFAMTSLVIIPDGYSGYIRHMGRLEGGKTPLAAGVYFKWPWPIDTAERFETAPVNKVLLGTGEERTAEQRRGDFINGKEVALWTQDHGALSEMDFIIAVPTPGDSRKIGEGEPPPPVNIIKLVVSVQYNIKDLHRYAYAYVNSQKVVQDIAYRQLTQYCARATLDSPVEDKASDRPEAIMTYGRSRAAAELARKIQADADEAGLGIEITLVSFLAVHPPPAAAAEFERVLKAERGQDEMRFAAESEATRLLTNVAGDQVTALHLALAIQRLDELKELAPAMSDKAQAARRLGEYTRSARDNLRVLDEELDLERVSGKGRLGEVSAKAQLRAAYQEHLALLLSIQQALDQGSKFDFAAPTEAAAKRADDLFALTTGQPAAMVARASAYRWQKEMGERGRWNAFQRELLAYNASPGVYMLDRWLAVWDEVLPGAYKYVLAVDRDLVECRLNWWRENNALDNINMTDAPPAGMSRP